MFNIISPKNILQGVCMLEKIVPSSLMVTLILDPFSMMLLFFSMISYIATTLTISREMLPPCYYLSRDINVIVPNMHPRIWIRLT